MPVAQEYVKTLDELSDVIANYLLIVMRAKALDPSSTSDITKKLYHAIFEVYTPGLNEKIESLNDADKSKMRQKLHELRSSNPVDAKDNEKNTSLESPLVLLLSLALEQGVISSFRENESEGKNWGRLGGFSDFFGGLKVSLSTNKRSSEYWPGLPTCVMTMIPVWSPQGEGSVSISSTVDTFEFLHGMGKIAQKRRKDRMRHLRQEWKEHQNKVDSITEFSRKIPENPYSKELWVNAELEEQNAGTALKKSKNPLQKLERHGLRIHNDWPAYLPVVVATWRPNGAYLRACPLDRVRFVFFRPPAAEEIENNAPRLSPMFMGKSQSEVINQLAQNIPTESGCAEWEGF